MRLSVFAALPVDLSADLSPPGCLSVCTFTYVTPERNASSTSAISAGAIPCPAGPMMLAAVTVPLKLPEPGVQAGRPPPPQRKKLTPPLTDFCPR